MYGSLDFWATEGSAGDWRDARGAGIELGINVEQ
jgi:hypothetical protein